MSDAQVVRRIGNQHMRSTDDRHRQSLPALLTVESLLGTTAVPLLRIDHQTKKQSGCPRAGSLAKVKAQLVPGTTSTFTLHDRPQSFKIKKVQKGQPQNMTSESLSRTQLFRVDGRSKIAHAPAEHHVVRGSKPKALADAHSGQDKNKVGIRQPPKAMNLNQIFRAAQSEIEQPNDYLSAATPKEDDTMRGPGQEQQQIGLPDLQPLKPLGPSSAGQEARHRRHSVDGVAQSTPLDSRAFEQNKLNQIDQESKRLARILQQFEASPRDKQRRIQEVLEPLDHQQRRSSGRQGSQMPPRQVAIASASSGAILVNDATRYSAKIEEFLDHLASNNFKEAEKCLQNADVGQGVLQEDSQLHGKKSVTFQIGASQSLQATPAPVSQKPPLSLSKQKSQTSCIANAVSHQTSQSPQNQVHEEADQAPTNTPTVQNEDDRQGKDPTGDVQFDLLGEILKLASSQESGSQKHLTSSRKLLAHLQQKMLLDQRNRNVTLQGQRQKDGIVREVSNDLNYLNVFVQPIGSINIFSQERQVRIDEEEARNLGKSQTDLDKELASLILQSPLKGVVDQRLLHLLNKTPKADSGPTKGQTLTSSSTEQLGVQALADVLDTILLGNRRMNSGLVSHENNNLETAGHKEMKEDIINQILPHYLPPTQQPEQTNAHPEPQLPGSKILQGDGNRYLKGIDVPSFMQYPATQSESNPSQCDPDLAHLFDLSTIQDFISRLQRLADDANDQDISEERIMTFLTEQYPREPEQVDFESQGKMKQKISDNSQTNQKLQVQKAKKVRKSKALENQLEVKAIEQVHNSRLKIIVDILSKIDESNVHVEDVSKAFVLTSTDRQKLIYLSFIEGVRQVAKHNRQRAILLLKIWNSYFSDAQEQVRNAAALLHNNIDTVLDAVQQLVKRVQTELEKRWFKDIEVIKLKQDFTQILGVLQTLTESLYKEESKSVALRERLENLQENLKLIYPNSLQYLETQGKIDVQEQQNLSSNQVSEQDSNLIEQSQELYLADQFAAFRSRIIHLLGPKSLNNENEEKPVGKGNVRWAEPECSERSHKALHGGVVTASKSKYPSRFPVTIAQIHPVDPANEEESFYAENSSTQQHEKDEHEHLGDLVEAQVAGGAEPPRAPPTLDELIVADIERLLRVLPAKIQVQKDLESARDEVSDLRARIEHDAKVLAKQERELRQLQASGTALAAELLEKQESYGQQLAALKKEGAAKVEEVRHLEAEKAKRQQAEGQGTVSVGTQTLLDGEAEAILRREEFSQLLVKYRGVNRAPPLARPKPTKAEEEAFLSGQPPLEDIYPPIMGIMRTVKAGKSKYRTEPKSVKNVLKMVAGLLQAKMAAMEKSATDSQALMNLDGFFYHHIQQTYGLEQLAAKYAETYLVSIEAHRTQDARIELFRKFIGLDFDRLPYSIFERYIAMVKATGIPPGTLLTQPQATMFVDYNRVRHTFRELLAGAGDYIQQDVFQQLKKYTRVVTENAEVVRVLELEDYEVLKDLQEQTIRSRYKSTANALRALFEDDESSDSEGAESESESSDDTAKEEKTVTLAETATFMVENFDLADRGRGAANLTRSKVAKRVRGMLGTFVIAGQAADPEKLTQRAVARGLRERIELRVPVSAYFHIGVNACVAWENTENQLLEKVYQFYSQLEVEVDVETGRMLTRDVKTELNLDGMDFQQFVLVLKDARSALVAGTNRQAAFEIYRTTCEPRQRQKMICSDFMEALRKHRLMPPAARAEKAMQDREAEVAYYIRAGLLDKGQPVPQALEEAAARLVSRLEESPEEAPNGMNSARAARLGDLGRLAGAGSAGRPRPKYAEEPDNPNENADTPRIAASTAHKELFPELAHSAGQARANDKATLQKKQKIMKQDRPLPKSQITSKQNSNRQAEAKLSAQLSAQVRDENPGKEVINNEESKNPEEPKQQQAQTLAEKNQAAVMQLDQEKPPTPSISMKSGQSSRSGTDKSGSSSGD